MPKKQLLEVGQSVWIESIDHLGRNPSKCKTTLTEMMVLEANKTSAYLWTEENPETKTRYKIDQCTHQVKYAVPTFQSYRLWLSQEDYFRNKYEKEKAQELRKEADTIIRNMNLKELRQFVEGNQ